MTGPRELALVLDDGVVVRDAGWMCVADVMKSFHAFGTPVAFGTIVYADTLPQLMDGSRCGID